MLALTGASIGSSIRHNSLIAYHFDRTPLYHDLFLSSSPDTLSVRM